MSKQETIQKDIVLKQLDNKNNAKKDKKDQPRPKEEQNQKKQELIRFLKFLVFSCTAGVIQFGTFTLLNEVAHLSYWPSYLIGLILSVVYNFTINRHFTFKSASNIPIAMSLVLLYYAVFTPLSTLWGDALTKQAGWNEYIVLAGTMVINFVTEFLFTRYVVFRKSINTLKPKKSTKGTQNKNEEKDV